MCAFCIPAGLPGTARHAILLTEHAAKHAHPERASRAEGSLLAASLPIPVRFTQLLSRQQTVSISPLAATLMNLLASVGNKRLTERLSPLDATLTKILGEGVEGHSFTSKFVTRYSSRYSSPSFSHPCRQSCATAVSRPFSNQSVTHSFRCNGGCTPSLITSLLPI